MTDSNVYKVVERLRNGKRVSYVITGRAQVEYEPNKETRPTFGKLLGFRSKKAARRFVKQGGFNHEIWLAKAKNPKRITMLTDIGSSATDLRKFWKDPINNPYPMAAPTGTVACDSIKLLKCVGARNAR